MSTSTKDAETHDLFKFVVDAAFAATNVETLLFGDYKKRHRVESYIYSNILLESLASTRIVENKFVMAEVNASKKLLEDEVFQNYTWIKTKDHLADLLTKDMVESSSFRGLFLRIKVILKGLENIQELC